MNKINSTHSALNGLCDSAAIRLADVVNEAIDQGHLRRADIVRVGKVTQQQAAVDLREIRKRFAGLLEYDPSSRRYVLLKEVIEPKWLDVSGVRYAIHSKPGSPELDARGIQHGLHDEPPVDLLRAFWPRARERWHLVAADGRRASGPGDGTRGHRPHRRWGIANRGRHSVKN